MNEEKEGRTLEAQAERGDRENVNDQMLIGDDSDLIRDYHRG